MKICAILEYRTSAKNVIKNVICGGLTYVHSEKFDKKYQKCL